MPLTACPECSHQISSKAAACPQCGHPVRMEVESDSEPDKKGMWSAVTKSRTPINVFSLAMMGAAAVFGASATQVKGNELVAFTYALHIFLAVVGMFFVCLLFCRSCIYHPDDLAKAQKEGYQPSKDRPVLAAILIGVMITGYALYQGFTYLYPPAGTGR